jgi:hypothetical protein
MTDKPTEAEIVEAMRIAIAIRWRASDKPDGYTAAQAALDAQRAMGLVLVPVQPTEAMVEAALFDNDNALLMSADCTDIRNAYRAMIAAAQGEQPC